MTRYTKDDLLVRSVAILMGCTPGSGLAMRITDLCRNGQISAESTIGEVLHACLLDMLRETYETAQRSREKDAA